MARVLVALAVLALGAQRANADEPRMRVGVVAAVAINVAADDVQALVGAFQRDLEAAYLVEAVPARAAAPPATCATDTACLVDMTGRLGVDRVVLLILSGVGRKLRIDVTVADAAGHATHAPAMIVELGAPDLDRRLADYTRALLPDAPPRPPPPPAPPPVPSPQPSGVVGLGTARSTIDDSPRRHDRLAWIAVGTTVVLLTGAAIAGSYASSAYDEYKTTMSPARYDLLRQRVDRDSAIANGLLIASAATAAAGATLFIVRF